MIDKLLDRPNQSLKSEVMPFAMISQLHCRVAQLLVQPKSATLNPSCSLDEHMTVPKMFSVVLICFTSHAIDIRHI